MKVGLTFETDDGLVPDYECREAAIFAGYTQPQWVNLEWYERAAVIAHYRVHNLVEAHVHDAADQERKRLERAAQRRRRNRQ